MGLVMSLKYQQLTETSDHATVNSRELFRLACCDCGLVHDVVIVGGRKGRPVGIAMRRNKRATAQKRRVK